MTTEIPLFRNDAVQVQQPLGLGTVNLATPLPLGYWLGLGLGLATIAVLLSTFGHYTRRETMTGHLLADPGALTLAATSNGIIAKALVRDGESVEEGQVLAEISAAPGNKRSTSVEGGPERPFDTALPSGAILRASRAGIVADFSVSPSQNVVAGQPILSILPQPSRLEAQLLVPSRAVGSIQVGSSVTLRYKAYPYQQFGVQYGKVRHISHSALKRSELESLQERESGESFYRVLVSVDGSTLKTNGKPVLLRPGMVLDADILLERRSLMQWIFGNMVSVDGQAAVQELIQ